MKERVRTMETENGTVEIEAKALRALAIVAPKRDPRKVLAHAIHVREDRAEATDGHVLLTIDHKENATLGEKYGVNSFIVDADGLKSDVAKATKRKTVRLAVRSAGGNIDYASVTSEDDARTAEVETIEGRYPNIDSIMPKNKPEYRIAFDPNLMLTLCKAVIEATKGDVDYSNDRPHKPAMVFEIRENSANEPVMITSAPGATTKFVGAVMPMRLKELQEN